MLGISDKIVVGAKDGERDRLSDGWLDRFEDRCMVRFSNRDMFDTNEGWMLGFDDG